MMEFVITDIKSKRLDGWVNPCHEDVLNKQCVIRSAEPGESAMITVDVENDITNLHYLRTSRVISTETMEDGTVVIDTRNSTYTLTPIHAGEEQ